MDRKGRALALLRLARACAFVRALKFTTAQIALSLLVLLSATTASAYDQWEWYFSRVMAVGIDGQETTAQRGSGSRFPSKEAALEYMRSVAGGPAVSVLTQPAGIKRSNLGLVEYRFVAPPVQVMIGEWIFMNSGSVQFPSEAAVIDHYVEYMGRSCPNYEVEIVDVTPDWEMSRTIQVTSCRERY